MTRFGILLGKELRVEARGREMLTGGLFLTFLVLVLADLAWGDVAPARRLAPGVLWIGLTFAGTLSLSRNLHRERDRGTWEALALLPVDRGSVYLAKAAASLVVLLVIEAFALPLYAILFDVDLLTPLPLLVPVFVLGAAGLAGSGTLLAAASSHGRSRETLLPILLFPLIVPLLMMSVQATTRILAGEGLAAIANELRILVAFDVLFLALGWLSFGRLMET